MKWNNSIYFINHHISVPDCQIKVSWGSFIPMKGTQWTPWEKNGERVNES